MPLRNYIVKTPKTYKPKQARHNKKTIETIKIIMWKEQLKNNIQINKHRNPTISKLPVTCPGFKLLICFNNVNEIYLTPSVFSI